MRVENLLWLVEPKRKGLVLRGKLIDRRELSEV